MRLEVKLVRLQATGWLEGKDVRLEVRLVRLKGRGAAGRWRGWRRGWGGGEGWR